MYSKEEAYKIKKKFWISFGQYMSLHSSSVGEKVNWLNYKTGYKDLYFRVNVNNRFASVFIEISSKDLELQHQMYERFVMFKEILFTFLGEEWEWDFSTYDEQGKIISTIGTKMEDVTIFREADWSRIISFFKIRLLALDSFWNDYKDAFEVK